MSDDLQPYAKLLNDLKAEGYTVREIQRMDYGRTIKALLERDGKPYICSLREVFYDTDENGQRTTYHGTVDFAGLGLHDKPQLIMSANTVECSRSGTI